MIVLRQSLVWTILVLLACQAAAQNRPVKICVASRSIDMLGLPSRDLANALSEQKLRSGRVINALSLQDISGSDLARKVQSAGCEYVVNLWPWRNQEPVSRPTRIPAFVDSESPPDWPTDHRGPDWPKLNYELLKVDHTPPVAQGTELSHRVYLGHFFPPTYRVDYSELASVIARKLGL